MAEPERFVVRPEKSGDRILGLVVIDRDLNLVIDRFRKSELGQARHAAWVLNQEQAARA